jgi:alpha-1,3-rhamnosyl/mannosyltransferase
VVAISHAAGEELVADLGVPREKIDVTLLGIRPEHRAAPVPEAELRARLSLDARPVVLCVAAKRRHKNLDSLVRAVAALGDDGPQLVLPGAPTEYEDELRELASDLGIAGRVRFPGWLEDDELEGLYGLAACFALPSFVEGFGLPVLEAMSRDVPVVSSNAGSLPEVVGDAALLFDPNSVDELAGALRRVLTDGELAAGLRARGRERCARFTWENTARQTLASYRRALGDSA